MPESLFHFCTLDSEDRRLWLERILVDNQVYFRSRDQLNDPNELRPSLVFEGSDKQMRKYVRDIILRHWPEHLSPARRLGEESKLIYQYRNKPEWVEKMLHETLDTVGVFSLSETSTHPLLWAHYAGGHRGVCVEFNANIGPFPTAQKMSYTDQAPVINRLLASSSDLIEKSMLAKGNVWAYEQEWRVIARWHDEDRIQQYLAGHDVPDSVRAFIEDQHGSGYYSFPVEAIRSVILGSRVEAEVESWLQAVIRRSARIIPVRRASITSDGLVTIEEL